MADGRAGNGGARPGAGRPKTLEKHAEKIEGFTDSCAAHLAPAFAKLWELVEGATREELKYAPAGTLTRKDVARDSKGEPIADKNGKLFPVDVKIFPGLKDEEEVLVERKTIANPPEIRAIQDLVDRVIGKPRQALELKNGEDGPLKIQVVYDDAEPPDQLAEAPRVPEEGPPREEAI